MFTNRAPLRSLFDGHPDLFVLSWQADSVTLNRWDVDVFRHHLQTAVLSDIRSRFTAVFAAMHQALYGTPLPPNKRIVEKSVEHSEFGLDLYHLYPDAKFIHIIRHPYANLVSLRRLKGDRHYPTLRPILQSFNNTYYYLLKNQRLIPNYFVIRYEDLVSQPKQYLQELANFVDIPFHDTLLQPTQLGEPWQGNSVYGTSFTTIANRSLHKWQQKIHPCEIALLHKAIPQEVMQRYGYERPPTNGRLWQPMRGESIKTYLANRFLTFLLP